MSPETQLSPEITEEEVKRQKLAQVQAKLALLHAGEHVEVSPKMDGPELVYIANRLKNGLGFSSL